MDWKKGYRLIRFLFFSVFLLHISACNSLKDEKEASLDEKLTGLNQAMILGDWYPEDGVTVEEPSETLKVVTTEPDYFNKFNLNGYRFLENHICENRLGFYEYIDPINSPVLSRLFKLPDDSDPIRRIRRSKSWIGNIIRSYGNRTAYRVSDDSLFIYDPGLKHWIGQRIEFHTADTLILSGRNDSICEVYSRKAYRISQQPLAEQIIIEVPQTHFSQPKIFSINRSGEFVCWEYNKGYSAGRIDEEVYHQVETWFKRATPENSLISLRDADVRYYEPDIDINRLMEPPFVTFVANDQIVTMYYMRNILPIINREFYQALFSTLFLPDHIRIQPCPLKEERISSGIWSDFWGITALGKHDSTAIQIYPNEYFYLVTLLLKAELTTRGFIPIYKLRIFSHNYYRERNIELVETDGRYYRYMINGKLETLDIGFNFIERYGLEERLSSEKVVARY